MNLVIEMAKQLVASYQLPVAVSSPRNTSFIASLKQTPADRKHLLPGGSNQIPSANHRQTPSQPTSLDRCHSDIGATTGNMHRHTQLQVFTYYLITNYTY
jgi:hypothetical protein